MSRLFRMNQLRTYRICGHCSILTVLCLIALAFPCLSVAAEPAIPLEISRPVHSWEFIGTFGRCAAMFGSESGNLEGWVYPLKVFRNFHLAFVTGGHTIPAAAMARRILVRPESSTIVYTGDTFTVKETLLASVDEPGVILSLDVETAQPLQIIAAFERDLQLEWPATLQDPAIEWDPKLHAFVFSGNQGRISAIFGSPAAALNQMEYSTNYDSQTDNSFRFAIARPGVEHLDIVLAASLDDMSHARRTYEKLTSGREKVTADAGRFYREYLDRTLSIDVPDEDLQRAYDWSRVSMVQGVADPPLTGGGLLAGFNISSSEERPGYAWFFGRDALWTSLTLDAIGDFSTVRQALELLGKFQRADGKIFHEMPQSIAYLNGFRDVPSAFASADSTPLYIVAADDYVSRSGDMEFLQRQWESIWKAYGFLQSTYASNGLPLNQGVGHGWVEESALLPVSTELYQAAVAAQATAALAHLAALNNQSDLSKQLMEEAGRRKKAIESSFWLPSRGYYAFGLDEKGRPLETATVLTSAALWFSLLDRGRAEQAMATLSNPEIQTDWGMRMLSAKDPRYDPGSYHTGSVWPLFTGWTAVGEYRYHKSIPAYMNLRANSLLTFSGSAGHVAEVLSGNYNQTLSTGAPHQIWSSAMVASSFIQGMLDLNSNAMEHVISLAPHLPADWHSFALHGVPNGKDRFDIAYRDLSDLLVLDVRRNGEENIVMEFSPALSPHAEVVDARLNGRKVPFSIVSGSTDQHVRVRFPLTNAAAKLEIRTRGDLRLSYRSTLPALGDTSHGLRLLGESWSEDRQTWTLQVTGDAGATYQLALSGSSAVRSIDGGKLITTPSGPAIAVEISRGADPRQSVTIHLTPRARTRTR